MIQDRTIGVFLHSHFSLPGWGQREMGFAGWKGLIDWALAEGFNACALFLHPQRRAEDPFWTYAEGRRLYHSLLSPRPKFLPGDVYYPKDPLLATPASQRNQELRQQAVRYAAEHGLRPYVGLLISLGSPTFAAEHPECQAVHGSDFCQEGLALSPMHPDAVDHLLDFWGTAIDAHPEAAGYCLWHSDPGVGDAVECLQSPERFVDFIRRFYDLIRTRRPEAEIVLGGWGLKEEIIPIMVKLLPKDIIITEPPNIHHLLRPAEEHVRRMRLWKDGGFRVQPWTEIQENPTVMLPACYPRRIEKTMRLAQEIGVHDFWAASSFYTYVFTLNHHVVSQLARFPEKTADQIAEEFLVGAWGREALPAAIDYMRALEDVWTYLYVSSQHQAGFNWPWHMVFAAGLFPPKLMKEPIPSRLVEDVEMAIQSAQRALAAAQRMSSTTWVHHPLETNVALVSAELLVQRAQFRKAKFPVLEAIREGDLSGAVKAFEELTRLAGLMVETAASAPNTNLLNTHWTKLQWLPEKLEAVKHHLPELVCRKEIRGIFTL